MPAVTQEWTHSLPYMQQTVLLLALRGPDGIRKYDPPKMLLRWLRRCILISAMDGVVLTDPYDKRGGSFTGPSLKEEDPREQVFDVEMHHTLVPEYIATLDAIPRHFHQHLMHAAEILGYKHPDKRIRKFWNTVYLRFVSEMHLYPETEEQMDARLGDNRHGWLERADPATQA